MLKLKPGELDMRVPFCGWILLCGAAASLVFCVSIDFFQPGTTSTSTSSRALVQDNILQMNEVGLTIAEQVSRQLMCAHHKTGCVLMRQIEKILLSQVQRKRLQTSCYCDNKFLDGSDTSAPAVHFIRDPFEAVVSGFLYHMRGSEPTWTGKSLSLRPNNLPKCGGPTLSAITACTQIPFFHNNRLASKQRCPIASAEDFIAWCAELPPVTNTECYSGYLSRVHDMADWKHAVMTEMVRFEAYERGAWESTMEEHLRDSLNILHVCLDIFMFDEHSFQFGARAIMEHLKIPAEKSEIILTSMQKLNPHISAGAQEHGTSHDEHREVLLSIVKDVDMEFFGGRFLALAEVVSDACQRFQEVVASHQNI